MESDMFTLFIGMGSGIEIFLNLEILIVTSVENLC